MPVRPSGGDAGRRLFAGRVSVYSAHGPANIRRSGRRRRLDRSRTGRQRSRAVLTATERRLIQVGAIGVRGARAVRSVRRARHDRVSLSGAQGRSNEPRPSKRDSLAEVSDEAAPESGLRCGPTRDLRSCIGWMRGDVLLPTLACRQSQVL